MLLVVRTLLLGACLVGASALALAQQKTTYGDLQKQGFEIRSTNIISLEDVKRSTPTATESWIYVILEKGESTAVCSFSWSNWFHLNESIFGPGQCNVR